MYKLYLIIILLLLSGNVLPNNDCDSSKTLDSLEVKNESFIEVIDSIIAIEQKCWYYNENITFRVDLQTYSDTINIGIQIADDKINNIAIDNASGFFYYAGHLYLVSAQSNHLIDLLFKKSEAERIFDYKKSVDRSKELQPINDDRRATYSYFYVNERMILDYGYPPCPR